MPTPMTDAQRRAKHVQKRRLAEESAARQGRMSTDAAISLYRREKARADKRNAGKKDEIREAVQRALAKADADRNPRTRPGRPKRLPPLHLKSDPANALINALDPWGFGE